MKEKANRQCIRGALFSLAVTLIFLGIFVWSLRRPGREIVALFLQVVVMVAAAPTYFFVKGSAEHPWIYCATAGGSYVIFAVVSWLIFGKTLGYWDGVSFIAVLGMLSVFFIVVLFLDGCVMLIARFRRGPRA